MQTPEHAASLAHPLDYFWPILRLVKCSALLQIIAGVLVKYVNFGKGWRHRLFVLQDGVLRYYKVCTLY